MLRPLPKVTLSLSLSLSLLAAGSTYSSGVVKFDVRKGVVTPSTSHAGVAAKEGLSNPADVIVVTVPRELRGRSEILVFLSEKPIQGGLRENIASASSL